MMADYRQWLISQNPDSSWSYFQFVLKQDYRLWLIDARECSNVAVFNTNDTGLHHTGQRHESICDNFDESDVSFCELLPPAYFMQTAKPDINDKNVSDHSSENSLKSRPMSVTAQSVYDLLPTYDGTASSCNLAEFRNKFDAVVKQFQFPDMYHEVLLRYFCLEGEAEKLAESQPQLPLNSIWKLLHQTQVHLVDDKLYYIGKNQRTMKQKMCKNCGAGHPPYTCVPCVHCGGAHYNNRCPGRRIGCV